MANHRTPYLVRIMMAMSMLTFLIIGTGVGHGQINPTVEKTTGPVSGLSVEHRQTAKEYRVLWPGHRIVTGTVESVIGELVKVNTGELLPRFLSAKEATDKGLPPLNRGDQIQVAINDQNLVVDYHLVGQEPWHRILRGQLVQALPVGQEWAVIRTDRGQEQALSVRPLARSKVSAIPLNVPAVFLTDETNKIIDATFGSDAML